METENPYPTLMDSLKLQHKVAHKLYHFPNARMQQLYDEFMCAIEDVAVKKKAVSLRNRNVAAEAAYAEAVRVALVAKVALEHELGDI